MPFSICSSEDILKMFLFAPSKLFFKKSVQKNGQTCLNMLIKWVKMDKKLRKLRKSWIFQLAHENLKKNHKVSKMLSCSTTIRQWHLETQLFPLKLIFFYTLYSILFTSYALFCSLFVLYYLIFTFYASLFTLYYLLFIRSSWNLNLDFWILTLKVWLLTLDS